MEGSHIPLEDIFCFFITMGDNGPDLIIDQASRLFTIISVLSKLSSQKDLFLFLTEGQRAEFFTHPPFTYHFPGNLSGPLNVIAGPCRLTIQYQLLCHPSSHHNRDIVLEVVFW